MDKPGHIVFDCERMKYPFTGLYYFCLHLGKSLLQQQTADELMLYLPASIDPGLFAQTLPVLRQHPLHKFSFPRTVPYLLWHCTYQGSNYFPRNKKLKIVLTVHDLNFLHDEDKPAYRKKRYLNSLAKKVARADAVVAISEFVKAHLMAQVDVPAQKIHVVYNGCNVSDAVQAVAPVNAPAKPFLFTIGTIVPKKNFHVLPACLLNNEYDLVIAGIVQDEDYLQKIKAKAEELGVAHRVHFA
ncbi:MAG TPA: glycosyltransferase, partial [Flavisolibacter sp.]|nr:glycosyltransferase [Flavisolibacter sp.]